MGPALIIPTSPKEFSSESLPPFTLERPKERARTKGVVRAPVVAPDASNDMARNSSDTSKARIKIIAYVIVINLLRGLPRRSLNTPKDIISPTPIETIYTIVKELKLPPEAASTWPPSISKSGSATVISQVKNLK